MIYDKLSASDYVELNKLNKKFNEGGLTLDEQIEIKNRLLSALSNSCNVIGETEHQTRNEVHELYATKRKNEDIKSLEGRILKDLLKMIKNL